VGRQTLEDLVADVAADGFDHERRDQAGRLAGGGHHHGTAVIAPGRALSTAREQERR
jgi:hypothetical protein